MKRLHIELGDRGHPVLIGTNLLQRNKKSQGGWIRMVLLRSIGQTKIVDGLDPSRLRHFIAEFLKTADRRRSGRVMSDESCVWVRVAMLGKTYGRLRGADGDALARWQIRLPFPGMKPGWKAEEDAGESSERACNVWCHRAPL